MSKGPIWALGTPQGSLQQVIVAPLMLGAAFLLFGLFPQAFSRGFRFSDYLKGSSPILALIAVTVSLTFLLTIRSMKMRAENGRPPLTAFLRNYGTMYFFGISLIFLWNFQNYKLARDLDHDGRAATARLERTFTESCSKHGCLTGIEYAFRPPGSKGIIKGTADEGNVVHDRTDEYSYITATHVVPIIYDPKQPRRSMVDWHGRIHRAAGPQNMLGKVIFCILIIGLPTGVATLIAWACMRDFDTRYRTMNNAL